MSKLKGKQKKLDVDNDGDIDGHDFKHLREKKSKKGKDVFEKAWEVVKGSDCATHNCEDNSAEKDWSYCGKRNCASCGGGCGDDNCRKCNPDEKW